MGNKFASNTRAFGFCDVCGFRYKLPQLRPLPVKGKPTNILACPECWNPSHPQSFLGSFPVEDPQALRNPRPDTTYLQSGTIGAGGPGTGSRDIFWGWAPVGGARLDDYGLTPNPLVAQGQIGTVTVSTT